MLQQALEQLRGQVAIRARYDNFIGGQWVPPRDGRYFDNLSPVTGQKVCEIARSQAADIELALDAAHKAKDAWGRTSPAERAVILNRIADRIEEKLPLLALVETIDNGKPIRETTAICRWWSIISVILPAVSAPRKAAFPRLITTPSPITSTNRWAWWARSSRGTSRC
jgi:acyl-CoA reductase-like NAD-dependent aldehyde dehydrogenase